MAPDTPGGMRYAESPATCHLRFPMHTASGRWLVGLSLAVVTAVLWGVLPIKLKLVLDTMDPVTVTWYRLLSSGLVLLLWLGARGELPRFRPLGRKGAGLVALAIGGLVSNYVLYLMGLNLLSPGTTQLVIQIAPFLLLISSLFVFRSEEHTSELQSRENLVCRLLLEKKKS